MGSRHLAIFYSVLAANLVVFQSYASFAHHAYGILAVMYRDSIEE